MASSATTVGLSHFPSSTKIPNKKIPKPLSGSIRTLNLKKKNQSNNRELNVSVKASVGASGPPSVTAGLYSSEQFELTIENVDKVLDNVRPYLIADGGNVDVVSVESGVVSLKLQGACGSCPSSTTTMKMGIERVLKEKFGDAIRDICQINDEQISETTVEAVNCHLDILRPAIKNFGGSVEVLSITDGICQVKYEGPDSIGSGIKAAIKERFPDIIDIEFTN
ncbi:nifU 1, chloroplastic [Olea europaea subsp. europaea]|uniref:NifU 1, chloroplastic n=2 Tax=Olea europaea subsp. europaea TaxID=158383 RepID=A0A8S0TT04_OLEEU|nr:nifU 1, chloroplastic [Olea europaea subsp. europaea]